MSDNEVTLETPILHLGVMVRVINALKNADSVRGWAPILTVGEVIEHSAAELLRIPNFGRVSLKDLEDELALHGFSLAGEPSAAERRVEMRIDGLKDAVHRLHDEVADLRQRVDRWERAMIDLSQRERVSSVEIAASRGLEARIQKLEELAGLRALLLKVPG